MMYKNLLSCIVVALLMGCRTMPLQEETAEVTLAVTSIDHWDEYISELSPNFKLTADEAINKIIPTTNILEEKLVDKLLVRAGIGLEKKTKTSTSTTSTTDGEATSSSEQSSEIEPGQAPDLPDATDKSISTISVPEGSKKVSKDPMLEYTAAAALYQEVKLLNKSIRNAALRYNATPYVVRLKIGVFPYKRNVPADVYTNVGFFPEIEVSNTTECTGDQTEKYKKYSEMRKKACAKVCYKEHRETTGIDQDSAVVVPLLVTDNLEGTLASRSKETVRQLSLAIAALQSNIQGTAGFDKIKQHLEDVLGTDVNSLLTVGRQTDNSVLIRLGAARQPSSQHAIVSRTHNISLLLMIPQNIVNENEKARVRVVSRSVFRDSETGMAFRYHPQSQRIMTTLATIEEYTGRKPDHGFAPVDAKENMPSDKRRLFAAKKIMHSVYSNNFKQYINTLTCAGWDTDLPRDMWIDIIANLGSSAVDGVRFQLPEQTCRLPEENEVVYLLDDSKTKMQARFSGGQDIDATALRAVLEFNTDNGTVRLPSKSVVTKEGSNPVIEFESAAAWKYDNIGTSEKKLVIFYGPKNGWQNPTSRTYKSLKYRTITKKPKQVVIVNPAVGVIRYSKQKQYGEVLLNVSFPDKNTKPQGVKLAVKNGQIKVQEKVTFTTMDKEKKPAVKVLTVQPGGIIEIDQPGMLNIPLTNLAKQKKVAISINPFTKKNGKVKSLQPKPDDIEISVVED